jgi:hypothetical protein
MPKSPVLPDVSGDATPAAFFSPAETVAMTRAKVCADILSRIDAPDSAHLTVGSVKDIVRTVAALKDE